MGKAKAGAKRQRKQPVLPEGFLTTAQATKELGVSPATLRRWVKEGRIEAVKVGKQFRYRQANLRQVVTSASEAPAEVALPDSKVLAEATAAFGRLRTETGRQPGFAEIEKQLLSTFPNADPLATLLARLLMIAVGRGSTDFHIEPFEDKVLVRYRIDGVLQELASLPSSMGVLVQTLKRMAQMDMKQKARPQDGKVEMLLGGVPVDLRINTMPAAYGEVAAVRIMDRQVQLPGLDQTGFEADQLVRWRRALHSPSGLILVAAPAGCGKTTTIYASLMELAKPSVKIMTAEDPIECALAGVSQSQINPDAGFDYMAAGRAMMRQAPNVMFIGEARTRECAEFLCMAALTGHMVFSTLHTNDAIHTVRRLAAMGVPLHLLASAPAVIGAQRLLRRTCAACRTEHRPDERLLDAMGIPADPRNGKFYYGKGCAECRDIGYRGRVAVIELLEFTAPVREAIDQGALGDRLVGAARESGWRPMREIALEKIHRGETTLEEAVAQGLSRETGA